MSSRRSLALLNITGLLFLVMYGFAAVVPRQLQRHYHPEENARNLDFIAKDDPILGSVVTVGLLPSAAAEKGVILAILSDCSLCNHSKLALLNARSKGDARVVVALILSASPADLKRLHGKYGAITFGSANVRVQELLNAKFLPRIYVLSNRHALTYIQPPAVSFHDALETVFSREVTTR